MATGPEIEITVDNRTKLSMIIANDHNDYFNIKYCVSQLEPRKI